MDYSLIRDAGLAINIHLWTVIIAILITIYMLFSRKGSPMHRKLGLLWVVMMAITCISTFFIHEIDMFHGFSLIHILSVLTLSSLVVGVHAARHHNVTRHRNAMIAIVVGGIIIAGVFAFSPGRLLYELTISGL